MANTTVQTPGVSPNSVLSILAKPFRFIGGVLVAIAEANSRQEEVQRLAAMSDEQLAKRGLKREDIVRYVFRDAMIV